jgi:hypothetical protein
MYSSFSPDFGCFNLMRMEVSEDSLTSFHVKSDSAECEVSVGASISPSLREPKKAVVEAAHMTCFVRGSQDVRAIFDPNVTKRGSVTTRLVFVVGTERAILEAPLSSWLSVKSSVMYSHEKPLSPCTNFIADRYDLIVDGANFLVLWHQTTKARQAVIGMGQAFTFLVSASKQA